MEHVASCSFGKDSLAQILIALEKGEPLDRVLYCEVMFTKEISGEIPEHREFIYKKAIPALEKQGTAVDIVRADHTFLDCFFHIISERSKKRAGKFVGFPLCMACIIGRDCKLKALKKFQKENYPKDTKYYLGIASDEQKRLDRLQPDQISLLAKYDIKEQQAKEICNKYDLLSPMYEFSNRGGCWFCPNAKDQEWRHLREFHRELWDLLLWLEKAPNKVEKPFNRKEYLSDIEQRLGSSKK